MWGGGIGGSWRAVFEPPASDKILQILYGKLTETQEKTPRRRGTSNTVVTLRRKFLQPVTLSAMKKVRGIKKEKECVLCREL